MKDLIAKLEAATKATAEATAAYFDAADDEEFIENLTKDIHRLLEEAVLQECKRCAQIVRNELKPRGHQPCVAWIIEGHLKLGETR